mgnify:FL=1
MKKVLISLLTGVILIGATPVQAKDKAYGDVYTLEYVYDFYGNIITNKDGSALITRVKHSVNSVEEYEFWLDNNFNNPVYMNR